MNLLLPSEKAKKRIPKADPPKPPPPPIVNSEPVENKLEFIPVSEEPMEEPTEEEEQESSSEEGPIFAAGPPVYSPESERMLFPLKTQQEQYDRLHPKNPPLLETLFPKIANVLPSPPRNSPPRSTLKRPREEGPGILQRAKETAKSVMQQAQSAREYLPDPNAGYMAPVWVLLAIFAKNFLPKLLADAPPNPFMVAPPKPTPAPTPTPSVNPPSIKDFSMFYARHY